MPLTDSGERLGPQLTMDSTGNWIAIVVFLDSLGDTIGDDYDILFRSLDDNGMTWSRPAPLNANASTDSGSDDHPNLLRIRELDGSVETHR